MRKIIASTFVTLDGFIDDPHLWALPYSDAGSQKYSLDLLLGSDILLLGRVTFEGMAQAWPSMSGDPYSDKVNAMTKYAVSSTLKETDWNNSSVIHGDDLLAEVNRLKQQPGGDILIWGCGRLTDTLAEHGLLDEYKLWIYPVVKGGGQPLFPAGTEATMELVDNEAFDSGTVLLTYRPVKTSPAPASAG
ncbi:dihydrofolate reductase family protein [Planobispora takensis]|uniref:Pyrimidine reductase n=1 Tax=Planobispora takensis TaxID=1367882 RepID=A0A8J3T435_9ACTN|nr:dihydrofolate reductase family protein [Planobispora takensis]GII03858.1 pyrimidine reductase [Planobispora takensis]